MPENYCADKRAISKVALIGVPLDLGGNRRGMDMGPSALRVTGLADRIREIGFFVMDLGDVPVPVPERCEIGNPKQKFYREIENVCRELAERVADVMEHGFLPVVLGGDHSFAMGSIAGVARAFRRRNETFGLIWLDAHGDMNTPESSPTGNLHGMPLAHVLGMGDPLLAGMAGFTPMIPVSRAVLLGIRDIDEGERRIIEESGIHCFTMKDIDRYGVAAVVDEAIEIASAGTEGIHVSFDMDVLDPSVARGVGTPKWGGLTYREAHLCLEIIAESNKLSSLDVAEVNPILDAENVTAWTGSELIQSALGKRII